MENPFSFFVLFVFGAAFGSFLNVLSLRYRPQGDIRITNFLRIYELVGGRSRCMRCGTQLRWFELVPILSFMVLRGRCGTCKEKISWQYPVVEMVSGLLFVLIPFIFLRSDLLWRSDLIPAAVSSFWIFVFLTLLLMSIIDLRHYIIPDELNVILFLSGFLAIALKMFLSPFQRFFVGSYALLFQVFPTAIFRISDIPWISDILILFAHHIVGALIAGGFFWLVHTLSKGRGMGFGDVKLAFALGFLLGWPDILFAMVFAFLLGGTWGALLLLRGMVASTNNESIMNKRIQKPTLKSKLPFGPFFAFGILWLVFFGEATLRWYFGLFVI